MSQTFMQLQSVNINSLNNTIWMNIPIARTVRFLIYSFPKTFTTHSIYCSSTDEQEDSSITKTENVCEAHNALGNTQ